MHKLVSITLLLSLNIAAAQSDDIPNTWIDLRLDGGSLRSLIAHPQNPDVLYTAARGGLFRSTDGAERWQSILGGTDVTALALEVDDLQGIYAVATHGLLHTNDAGQTWVTVDSIPGAPTVRDVVVDPTNSNIVYIATSQGVFKSTDAATTWTPANEGLAGGDPVTIAVDAASAATLFVGFGNSPESGSLFRTDDGGLTWLPAGQELPRFPVNAIVTDPVRGNVLYVVLSRNADAVFRSVDGGLTWRTVSGGLPQQAAGVGALIVDPSTPQRLYIGMRGFGAEPSVLVSENEGDIWTPVAQSGGPTRLQVNGLALRSEGPSAVYAATGGGGLFRSTDGGESWSNSSSGLPGPVIVALAIDPTDPETVYAGSRGGGTFKLTDGATWRSINHGIAALTVNDIVLDPNAPQVLYAGAESNAGVFRSIDGGDTWVAARQGIDNRTVRDLMIDPGSPRTIYAAVGHVAKSTNAAESWVEGVGISGAFKLAFDPFDSQVLYAATQTNGVFNSIDAGATWAAVGSPGGITVAFAADPSMSAIFYAGTVGEPGFAKSTDGGVTWMTARNGLTGTANAVIVDPIRSEVVYAATDTGVFKSTNAGGIWQALNTGLTNLDVEVLSFDPSDPNRLYAGTNDGVFRIEQAQNVCGDGIVDGTEQCDLGEQNGNLTACCTAGCELSGPSVVCRPAANDCDRVETCPEDSSVCPRNTSITVGTPCADDGNPCTAGTCDGLGSCRHRPASGACDDGNVCTVGESCRSGQCVEGAARTCDSCEICEPERGCISVCTPTPLMPVCDGDCNRDGRVHVDEIVTGVNIALGSVALGPCPAADADSSGDVTIDELMTAVTRALEGCPAA